MAQYRVVALGPLGWRYESYIPVGNQPDEFAKMLAEDLQRWTQLIKDAGIQPQ